METCKGTAGKPNRSGGQHLSRPPFAAVDEQLHLTNVKLKTESIARFTASIQLFPRSDAVERLEGRAGQVLRTQMDAWTLDSFDDGSSRM